MAMTKYLKRLLLPLVTAAIILAPAASQAASDDPTPYIVDVTGITLPDGVVFTDHGHVNIRTDKGPFDVHFEGKCIDRTNAECAGERHERAQFIGKSFIPWSAFTDQAICVEWVQMSQYTEHFGEGGQEPVGPGCIVHDPEPPFVPETETYVETVCSDRNGFEKRFVYSRTETAPGVWTDWVLAYVHEVESGLPECTKTPPVVPDPEPFVETDVEQRTVGCEPAITEFRKRYVVDGVAGDWSEWYTADMQTTNVECVTSIPPIQSETPTATAVETPDQVLPETGLKTKPLLIAAAILGIIVGAALYVRGRRR